jgi:PAS domain S-box-containing protein
VLTHARRDHAPPAERFDSLTRLAAKMFQVPVSFITLTGSSGHLVASSYSDPSPRLAFPDDSLLQPLVQHVTTSGQPLVIPNVLDHAPAQAGMAAATEAAAYAGVPLHAADGHVLGVFSIVDGAGRDWSEREMQILEELATLAAREVEQSRGAEREEQSQDLAMLPQLRALVEHSLAGIYMIQEGRITYANPKLREIFGYGRDEIGFPERPAELVLPEDRNRVEEHLQQRLDGEVESSHYSFRGLRKDGSVIDVEVLGSRTEIGGEPAIVGMLLDITEQTRTAETLRRREAHFRSLLENAWDIIHEVDADGIIRYISPSVERVLGYRPEEMVGKPAAAFVHPDDLPTAARSFEEKITQPGSSEYLEIRLRHRNGSWRTGEVQARVLHDGTDAPMAVVNTHDVTEARRVQEALRQSEERYRLVARATNSAIRDWDVRTGECSWIGASNILLRYTAEEIGSTVEWWYERIHPEDREGVINGIQGAIDGVGDSWVAEYRFLRGHGEFATVLDYCYIARDDRGSPLRVIGSLLDVTERKRADDAQRFLAQASALLSEDLDLAATLASLARLTLPTLADYCLIDLVEEQALRRVGFAHIDPVRESMFHRKESHTLDGDPTRHPVIRVVRSQEPVLVTECTDEVLKSISHDEEHLRKLREIGLCSFMIVPLVAHGKTLGVITLASADSGRHYAPRDLLVAQDLAHRAALAIEHAQLFRQAQAAIVGREEILGVVSHDLRNPLNTIRLSADMLLHAEEERRTANVQSLDRILRASSQMESMIADLLDISIIEAGRFAVDRSPYPLASLMEEAYDMFQPLTQERSIRLECVLEEGKFALDIDARQILRVFSNLVGNAIKFTPERGAIVIRASDVGAAVHFSVSDTGPGIPPEQLSHVFERYWQARIGDRRGAGLGLSIAKGIVEAHGGAIWAENNRPTGAVFCFTIPFPPMA